LLAAATRHDWPGNVRALRNFAQQLVIGWCDASEVPRDPAIDRVLGAAVAPPVNARLGAATRRRTSDISEAEVIEALRQHGYRPSAAATSLFKLMKSHPNVRSASDLERAEIESSLAEAGGDVKRAAAQLEVSERALRMRIKALGFGGGG
jgi:two-component system nitrogen regulation response regulator GlnG